MKFLIYTIFIELIFAGVIIQDKQNPILVYQPIDDIFRQSIIFTFTLPYSSQGLGYKQVIGVQFPNIPSFLTDLGPNVSNNASQPSPFFTCKLIDINNGKFIK